MTRGFYNGFTYGIPTPIGGVGGGLYVDNYGNIYPQIYYGTPYAGGSTGYSPDLEGLLTGVSISANSGTGIIRHNFGRSGDSTGAGAGFGAPGVGVTYGFGPYRLRDIGESFRPRTDEFGNPFPGDNTAAIPSAGSNSEYNGAPGLRTDQPGAGADTPERYLARRTDSRTQGSAFSTAGTEAPLPASPEGPFSLNDAYLEYLRRLNADQPRDLVTDAGSPSRPLVPSDDANSSGGLRGWLSDLMGVDPENPISSCSLRRPMRYALSIATTQRNHGRFNAGVECGLAPISPAGAARFDPKGFAV